MKNFQTINGRVVAMCSLHTRGRRQLSDMNDMNNMDAMHCDAMRRKATQGNARQLKAIQRDVYHEQLWYYDQYSKNIYT